MARLFAKHPLTVFMVVKSDQFVLDTGERTYDKLARASFESIDEGAEESSLGFVVLEDYRSTSFGPGEVELGEYVVGALRIDARKPPKSAVDKLTDDKMDEEKARLKDEGKEHVSKARRAELRTQAELQVRTKTVPTIKVIDFWWNTQTGLVFLTDKAPAAVAAFMEQFELAFGPEFELRKVELTNVLPRANDLEEKIGPDFLTWLWTRRQSNDNEYLAGGIPFEAYIDDDITIVSNQEKLSAKSSGGEDVFAEIGAGIKSGKRVDEALIKFEYGEGGEHWATFKLKASLFPIVELSIPNAKVKPGDDFAGSLVQQIGTIEEAYNRLRLLLVCYATMHKPAAIALGLQPPAIAELRDMPDMISEYLEEGGALVSFRNRPFIAKAAVRPSELEEAV